MRFLALLTLSIILISGCGREAPREVQFSRPAAPIDAESRPIEVETTGDVRESTAESSDASHPRDISFEGDHSHQLAKRELEAKPRSVEQPTPREQQRRARPDRPQPMPQPNLLTAGSLNDHANRPAYREYLAEASRNGAGRLLPEFALGPVATIRVVGPEDQGIPNAVVTLHHPKTNEILLTTRTRADGTTSLVDRNDLLTQFDEPLPIEVRCGLEFTRQAITLQEREWMFRMPGKPARLPHRLDVAFVIDTTGTMNDELEYLKAEIDHVASTLQTQFPDVEQRFALVCYRDHYDEYLTRTFDFADSVSEFRGHLSTQVARGGGDYPEAVHLGLEKATQLSWRTDNSARLVFLVGDAPPHRNQVDSTFTAVEELRGLGVAMYPLAGSGTKPECEFIFRAMAFLTRGQYLFLTDHSGVGHAHETPYTARFEVEPLNQLLVRVMAEELSGRSMLAQDVIAVEDGETPPMQVALQQHEHHHPHEHEHHGVSHHSTSHGVHVAEVRYESSAILRMILGAVAIGFILWIDRRMRV